MQLINKEMKSMKRLLKKNEKKKEKGKLKRNGEKTTHVQRTSREDQRNMTTGENDRKTDRQTDMKRRQRALQ